MMSRPVYSCGGLGCFGCTEAAVAQYNVARLKAAPEDLGDFLSEVERVNALADAAPGFLWRYKADGQDNSLTDTVRDGMVINLTTWRSPEDLWRFTYTADHLDMLKRRRDWFVPGELGNVLWWVRPEHQPSVAEADARLDYLREFGASYQAFTFKEVTRG